MCHIVYQILKILFLALGYSQLSGVDISIVAASIQQQKHPDASNISYFNMDCMNMVFSFIFYVFKKYVGLHSSAFFQVYNLCGVAESYLRAQIFPDGLGVRIDKSKFKGEWSANSCRAEIKARSVQF